MDSPTSTNDLAPLATYIDGSVFSTFGRRECRLFADCVLFSGNRWGEKAETKVSLEGLRPEPEHLWVHGQMFHFSAVLAVSALLLLLLTSLIFGNYEYQFTGWYIMDSLLVALGGGGCIKSFRGIYSIRFLNENGMAMLAVVAHHKSKRAEQDVFVAAIQKQILQYRETRKKSQ